MLESVPPRRALRDAPGPLGRGARLAVPAHHAAALRRSTRRASPPEAGPEVPLSLRSPETVGLYAGRWCPYGLTPDLPWTSGSRTAAP